MKTIYQIKGGGQAIRQQIEYTKKTETIVIEKIENSDLPEKAQCVGQDSFTNLLWAEDLDTVKRWANGWAAKELKFEVK